MKLFVVRHGETDSNLTETIQGHLDVGLNACGKVQAEALSRRFLEEKVDYIYSSDLIRASSTAIPVASSMNLPIHYRVELRERNYGVLQGRPVHEYLDALSSSESSWEDFKPEGGESIVEFRKRVDSFICFLNDTHRNDTILLVSHSGTNRILLGMLMKLNSDDTRKIEQSNTNVSLLEITSDRTTCMIYSNCTTHLT
jgi:broad specificity phosphatase PhoE